MIISEKHSIRYFSSRIFFGILKLTLRYVANDNRRRYLVSLKFVNLAIRR